MSWKGSYDRWKLAEPTIFDEVKEGTCDCVICQTCAAMEKIMAMVEGLPLTNIDALDDAVTEVFDAAKEAAKLFNYRATRYHVPGERLPDGSTYSVKEKAA